MPSADSFLDQKVSADSFLDEGDDAYSSPGIPDDLSERERKRLDLLSQLAAAQGEQRQLDRNIENIDSISRTFEPFTPSGLLNQPGRMANVAAQATGAGSVQPDQFEAGKPIIDVQPAHPNLTGVQGGAERLLASIVGGLTTPEMVVTAPAAAVSRPALAYMGVDMARHLPEQVETAAQVAGDIKSTPGQIVEAVGAPVLNAGFSALMARHANPEVKMPPPELPVMTPEQARVNAIAANQGAPGTVGRVAERSEMAAPVIEPPAEIFQAGKVPFDRMRRFGGPLPPIDFIDVPATVNVPRAELGAGGKMSFAAEAPTLLRNAVEEGNRAGLTKSAAELQKVAPKAEPVSAPEVKPPVTDANVQGTPPVADFASVKSTENAWDFGRARQTPEGIAELESIQAQIGQQLESIKADPAMAPMDKLNARAAIVSGPAHFIKEAISAAKNEQNRPAMTEYFQREVSKPAEPVKVAETGTTTNLPEVSSKLVNEPAVTLYRGQQGAGAGGAHWSSDPTYARSFGPDVQEVTVPKSVADAARAEFQKTGSGTPGAHLLPDEWQKQAKPMEVAPEAKVIDVTAPDVVTRLESLKFDNINKEGQVFSLPHPDAIKAIGKQVWNDSLDLAIAAVKAGRSIAEGIEQAIQYLRKNVPKFDETQARANLDYVVKAEAGTKPEATATVAVPEGQNMRKSAARATTAESIPEQVQQRIANAPESFYEPQKVQSVTDQVQAMTDLDLAAVKPDSNIYVASQLESANRLFKAGKLDEGYKVFEALEKEGTSMGQNINQFKLLDGSTPEQISYVVNRKLKEAGRDALDKKQNDVLMDLGQKAKEADGKLNQATEAWKQKPTPENAKLAEDALDSSNKAALDLQKFISKYEPRSTSALLKSILQGNLLTPISETANIVGNLSFLPFRAGSRAVASGIDMVDSFLRNKPREVTVQPIAGTVEVAKGALRGAKEIPGILAKGSGSVIKGETRAGLQPIKAWITQFSKNPEAPLKGGKLTLQDRVNLAIEGTFGVPAETMLRGLGAGDAPFREAARARIISEQLRLNKVPRDQWGFAQKFPELFFDRETMSRISNDSAAAIFQGKSKVLNYLTRLVKEKGDLADLAFATIAPYKLTPWNIIGEVLSYNPLVAMFKTVKDAKNGNSRSAKLNAGKMVIGSTMALGAAWLYNKGLIAPSLDSKDEAQKARVLSGQVLPPNHINLSGLNRAMSGGDPSFKPGDKTADFFRSGGLAGSMLYMAANVGRDFERETAKDAGALGSILRQSTLEQARFGLNQSFLQGVEGFLAAVKDGNVDNYLRQWFSTVLSIPLPNSLGTLSRATRDYKPDFREEDFSKQISNSIKNRLGFSGLDDYLPLKRDFWGQPMRETPEGKNAIFHHFFDVSKNQQVTDDPVALELYRLWRKTADSAVIPSLVDKQLTLQNKTYPLTAAQQSRYAELVGNRRRQIVDALVVNPNFHKLSDERKIDVLEKAYQNGQQYGKALFWQEAQKELQAKPGRAGLRSSQFSSLQ